MAQITQSLVDFCCGEIDRLTNGDGGDGKFSGMYWTFHSNEKFDAFAHSTVLHDLYCCMKYETMRATVNSSKSKYYLDTQDRNNDDGEQC